LGVLLLAQSGGFLENGGMNDTFNKQGCGLSSGCKTAGIGMKLRGAGLRPTRQRLALGALLFGSGDRHVSAEMLHVEALNTGEQVSLATVYNTLHQFTEAGLLRELAIDGGKAYFDTNISNHNHFFVEHESRLIDIPGTQIRVDGLPEPPEGMKISHIDVVVRLVAK
jgi:Fur family transcriptional regulator, iron response regulator